MDLTTLVEGKTHKKSISDSQGIKYYCRHINNLPNKKRISDSQGIKNYFRHINNLCKDSRLKEVLEISMVMQQEAGHSIKTSS